MRGAPPYWWGFSFLDTPVIGLDMGCVYKIVNKINEKVYIGKTIKNGLSRFKEHVYNAITYQEPYKFYRAIRKYGKENFELIILLNSENDEVLKKMEIFFIVKYKSMEDGFGYNMTEGGDGSVGYRHTEETKKKIGKLGKGKLVGKKNPMFGKTHTSEVKEKIRKAAIKQGGISKEAAESFKTKFKGKGNPFYGKKHSKETKELLSKLRKGKGCRKVRQIDMKTGGELETFVSVQEATKSVGLKNSISIVAVCKGRQHTAAGYKWKYV